MLKKNRQQRYLVKKDKQWRHELKAFGETLDQEAIHRLRVNIKKIKAFARFSRDCSGRDTMKDFNLLKKMYRQAGIYRDAGNNLRFLQDVHPAPEFLKQEQEQLQQKASELLISKGKDYRKRGKKVARRLLGHVRAIPADRVKDWYGTELIKIGVLLNASGDELHQARKAIKSLLYVLDLLPPRIVKELRLNRDYLDQLQESIGQWHDTFVVTAVWNEAALVGVQALFNDCHDKELVVRTLAGDFYRRAHLY
jgi:CHAD domain-containing protein